MGLVKAGAENVLHLKTSIFSRLTPKQQPLTKDVLHRKYVLEGLSTHQIADQLASSRTAITDAIRRFGIPLRSRGASHGRPSHPPFGFMFRDGRLVEHPGEQKTVRLIRTLVTDQKKTVSAVARELTERGIPTKAGKAHWHHEMVRLILKRYGISPSST